MRNLIYAVALVAAITGGYVCGKREPGNSRHCAAQRLSVRNQCNSHREGYDDKETYLCRRAHSDDYRAVMSLLQC